MNVLRPGEVLTREKMLLAIEHEEWTWLGRAIGETPEGSVLLPYEEGSPVPAPVPVPANPAPAPAPAIAPERLGTALSGAMFALSFHNLTPTGKIRECLPECVACAAISNGRAALAAAQPEPTDPQPWPLDIDPEPTDATGTQENR